MTSIQATRGRYQAEGSPAFFDFVRRIQADGSAFTLSGGDVAYPRGFYVSASSGSFSLTGFGVYPQRSLRMLGAQGTFSLALLANALRKGFALEAGGSTFVFSASSAGVTRAAFLSAASSSLSIAFSETPLARTLLLASASGSFAVQGQGSGFKSGAPMPAAGQPRPKATNAYGGSDDTSGSFLRPQYVKRNSAFKAQDLGVVSNLLAVLTGTIGSQSGASTLYYVVETDGPAQLRIRNTSSARYVAGYVSVGVLDISRNPIPLNEEGFAYRTDNHATEANESTELFPAGVYYFTISSSQWQSIPFKATLQVFRYRALAGAATGSLQPYARFSIAKLISAATWTAPLSGSIPANAVIKKLQAAATGSGQPALTLSIMRGAAGGTLAPYGRLKQTHRIAGVISGSNSNVATLSSAPPYGYGY